MWRPSPSRGGSHVTRGLRGSGGHLGLSRGHRQGAMTRWQHWPPPGSRAFTSWLTWKSCSDQQACHNTSLGQHCVVLGSQLRGLGNMCWHWAPGKLGPSAPWPWTRWTLSIRWCVMPETEQWNLIRQVMNGHLRRSSDNVWAKHRPTLIFFLFNELSIF